MNTTQLLQHVGSLVAGLALSVAASGCSSSDSPPVDEGDVDTAFASINDPSPPLGLHIVPNCRLVDTRGIGAPPPGYGLPALVGGNESLRTPTRDFAVAGKCGVPANAKAIATHIATVNSANIGFLMIGPATAAPGLPPPLVASLNFEALHVAADGTTLELGVNGFRVFSNQNTHFVVDITGYYTELPQPPIRVTPVGPFVAGIQQTSTADWDALNNVCGTQGTNDVPTMFTNGENHTPPLGTGSFDADLTSAAFAANGGGLDSQAFNGRKVGTITGWRYSTRQDMADAPHLTMDIDTTGGTTPNKTLYFFPANNPSQGSVAPGGVWQTWDGFGGNWNTSGPASPVVGYSNDFSIDNADWTGNPTPGDGAVVLVGDGTATETGNAYTKWGGYSTTWPTYGYTTSVDVFIDTAVDGEWDFTSAINRNAAQSAIVGCDMTNGPGCWLRDFVFNVAATGGNWNVSTSNMALQDPLSVPLCASLVSSTPCHRDLPPGTNAWYTFEHNFHDNGGVLEVTLTMKQQIGGAVVQSWILSNPSDVIATMVGGNRYGWFVTPTVPSLLIDNAIRTTHGGLGPTGATYPLSDFSNATILGVRAVLGCSTGAASGHEAVDDFEIAFDGNPATIYDFERQ